MKFEILTFLPAQRKFTQFFCAELETRVQILLKLSTALYCQDRKLLCQFFAQAIYLLDKSNQWNLKFWPSHLLKENSLNFFCAELETRVQILLKLSIALYCQDRKLMCPFSPQAISLLDETNRRNLKFRPSRLFEEILPVFARLNWKPQFRFCWNFPQPFTVRRGNCCVNFLLRQFFF